MALHVRLYDAILRHRGEATEVSQHFLLALSEFDQWCLLIYLSCL